MVMRRIFKTLLGVVVGLGYGVLIGGSVLLIGVMAGDPPVDLMLDYRAILRTLILVVTVICGSAGALVGLLVTLVGADKVKARTIGFGLGWVILAGLVFTIWPQLKNELSGVASWTHVTFLFSIFLVLFIVFPVGLAATGVTIVRVSGKFPPT
jgi:hypothetical protein